MDNDESFNMQCVVFGCWMRIVEISKEEILHWS